MSNLTILNDDQQFTYDWELIEDTTAREVVQKEVTDYQKTFETNRQLAEQIVTQDTIAKAKCVFEIKQQLPHGQFLDVCQEALSLNKYSAAAYVNIHKRVLLGAESEDVLFLVSQMEPRAAAYLLKSDEETKVATVETFKESGRVPSRNQFTKPKAKSSNNEYLQRKACIEYNVNRNLENAFADSPASPYYKPSAAPQPVVDVAPANNTYDELESHTDASEDGVETLELQSIDSTTETEDEVVVSAVEPRVSSLVQDTYELTRAINQFRKQFYKHSARDQDEVVSYLDQMAADIQIMKDMAERAKYRI